MTNKQDTEFEQYLSEFRPRGIAPLNVQSIRRRAGWLSLAAAVLLLAIGTTGIYIWRQEKNAPSKANVSIQQSKPSVRVSSLTAAALTRLALEDDAKFERVLAEQSRSSLPNLRGDQSTLRILANE